MMKDSDSSPPKCPNCGSTTFVVNHQLAETICDVCGLVQENSILPIGGNFSSKTPHQRDPLFSKNMFYPSNQNFFTEISGKQDSFSSSLDNKENIQNVFRLKKWHKRLKMVNSSDRNLSFALGELSTICLNISLSVSTTMKAIEIYKLAVSNNVIRGRSVEGVITASVYAASRIMDTPRTLEELSNIVGVTKKEIGRTYRFLIKTLNLKIPLTQPRAYVPRFCSVLNLDRETFILSQRIIDEIYDEKLYSGRGPIGICAATIYLASDFLDHKSKITQKDISKITGVTEVTIRNRYKEIYRSLLEKMKENGFSSVDELLKHFLTQKNIQTEDL